VTIDVVLSIEASHHFMNRVAREFHNICMHTTHSHIYRPAIRHEPIVVLNAQHRSSYDCCMLTAIPFATEQR